jgi:ribonuclease VapC
MVIDTSALLAMLLDEPDAESFREAVADDEIRLVSAATLLEVALVIEARKGDAGGRELDLLVQTAVVEVVAVDADHVAEARRAYRRYGRGSHPASLNFGDVFAYALSRTSGEALPYKGESLQPAADAASVVQRTAAPSRGHARPDRGTRSFALMGQRTAGAPWRLFLPGQPAPVAP